MVRAATAAEEEYKDTLSPYAGAPAPVHPSMIDQYSLIGHDTPKPVCDGPSVHLLVLHVEPATLQASTLTLPNRDASVERSPPAANLLQPVKEWSGRECCRGPSARLISLPSQSSHKACDRHSSRTCVPPGLRPKIVQCRIPLGRTSDRYRRPPGLGNDHLRDSTSWRVAPKVLEEGLWSTPTFGVSEARLASPPTRSQ